jgi:hypothetical protein
MGEHGEGRPVVFRNWPFWLFAWAVVAFMAFLLGLAAVSIGGGGTFGVAVIFAVIAYVAWLIGCHSAVRMDGSGMIVDDVLTRHVIPWGELLRIDVRGGLVFEVRGGPYIHMTMCGGSLMGVVTGYRLQRKTATRMNAARERFQASEPAPQPPAHYARTIGFSPWPPLVILAAMEAVAVLAWWPGEIIRSRAMTWPVRPTCRTSSLSCRPSSHRITGPASPRAGDFDGA